MNPCMVGKRVPCGFHSYEDMLVSPSSYFSKAEYGQNEPEHGSAMMPHRLVHHA